MKFLKIFLLFAVIIILILAVVLVILWQTFDINKYKPQITQKVSEAVGRDVTIGDISLDLSLSNGATIGVNKLVIADDKNLDGKNFLELDSVDLNVDILKFITQKQLQFTRIEVNGPRVNLIRFEDGRLNIPVPPPSDEPMDLSGLSIDKIRIKNGAVYFTDHTVSPALIIPVTALDVSADHFAFDRPVDIQVRLGIYSAEQNFDAAGSLKIDPEFKNISLNHFKLNSRLSAISLEDLKKGTAFVPFIQNLKRLQGDIGITVPEMAAGSSGLKAFTAEASLKDFVLITPDVPVPLNGVSGGVNFTSTDLEFNDVNIPLAAGNILFSGKIGDYWMSRRLSADVQVDALDISELMKIIPGATLPEGIGLGGKLNVDLSVSGSAFNPDPGAILYSLIAEGRLSVDQGVVEGFNLMQALMTRLDRLSQILGIGIKDEIMAKLPDEYKNKLDLRDMPIRQLETVFNLKEERITFSNAVIGVDEGMLMTDGSIGLDQNLSLAPQVFVNPALTEVFVRSVEDLKVLVGDDGRLSVPLKPYNGPISTVSILPDTDYLIKKLGTVRVKKELKGIVTDTLGLPGDIVDVMLGGGDGGSPQRSGEQQSSDAREKATIKSKQESTPGQLIGGVLDKILGQ